MVGHDDPGKIHLIDFGLSTPIYEPDGTHVERTNINRFCGNYVFGSLGTCRGFNKSRKDDIEQAFYLLIYLLNDKNLPWKGFEQKFKKYGNKALVKALQERQKKKYTLQLFKMIPNRLHSLLKEVLCLDFDQEPPYSRLISALSSCLVEVKQ